MLIRTTPRLLVWSTIVLTTLSCGNNNQQPVEKEPIILKKDKPRSKNDSTVSGVPIINISDTVSLPAMVLCVKDSAINNIRLSQKLNKIYGEKIPELIKKNKINAFGPPMAWYKTQKAPFFFEAGIPVDKKPVKIPKGFFLKKINTSKVIVAHFFGPYEETTQAYQVLKEWIKDADKHPSGAPYEVYVGDPYDSKGKPVDPYKVQTDIVHPYQ
jgi:effector-binding domain-containing protein